MSAIDLRRYREAYRHGKTYPHPPPNRQRIHVISPPGFFHPLGRHRFPRCFRLPRHAPSPCRPMTYMACCKVCCGCKECDEGEGGKCCCGNECCQPGTHCCNAECVQPCSEGQEGDCKCTDVCCYQDEYCCNDACVPACAEGDAGPCKCGSSCCAEGEYCCDGVCRDEPCVECELDGDCAAGEKCCQGECTACLGGWAGFAVTNTPSADCPGVGNCSGMPVVAVDNCGPGCAPAVVQVCGFCSPQPKQPWGGCCVEL